MACKTIKVLTYNIHKGMNTGNRRFVLHTIKDSLRAVDADIVMLQEIHGEHAGSRKFISDWPDNNQLEFLADEVWRHNAYAKNAVYEKGHHGNAVLSKFPVQDWENINVSLTRRASRSLLHAVIEQPEPGKKLHIICVHLGLFNFERDQQLKRLVSHIGSLPREEPLIIAGDFNDWRGKATRHLNNNLGISEVFQSEAGAHARTFPAWLPVLKMDRVYVRGVELVSCQQLLGKPWRSLSDHIPLLVELQLS